MSDFIITSKQQSNAPEKDKVNAIKQFNHNIVSNTAYNGEFFNGTKSKYGIYKNV